ncbi:DUF4468 domain-containing protein [Polaribacter sp. PL03]|uniref:DUF4468 domain-containing protein n=1 Tax=Polaribacter sp. PL03 TaxID=3088353 RepID=UPI0029D00AA1|nr:DUF4468 domain-containing protein [Polaribacter sp. PL03]MDX6748168.1 DUF4468 domain-containing protein [Polaribacter sp. PL03]
MKNKLKKIALLFTLLTYLNSYSQEKFKFDNKGLNDYLVINFKDKAKSELYSKSINWIKETFKKPEEVINSKIANEKIFIEGISPSTLRIGSGSSMNAKYIIEIAFKEGKIKFTPTKLEYYTKEYGWNEIFINENAKRYYKNSGKVRGLYSELITDIPSVFNNLSTDLENYINGKKKTEEDW